MKNRNKVIELMSKSYTQAKAFFISPLRFSQLEMVQNPEQRQTKARTDGNIHNKIRNRAPWTTPLSRRPNFDRGRTRNALGSEPEIEIRLG